MTQLSGPGPEGDAEDGWQRAEQARKRAREAHERSVRAHERAVAFAQHVEALKAGGVAPSEILKRAAEAVRESADAAERALELAAEGYERAAVGLRRAAKMHEALAGVLEHDAQTIPGEGSHELLERARAYRVKAAGYLQEAEADGAAVEELRGGPDPQAS